MEYYGLRKRGEGIDLVISEHDYIKLEKHYPEHKKDISVTWGSLKMFMRFGEQK